MCARLQNETKTAGRTRATRQNEFKTTTRTCAND